MSSEAKNLEAIAKAIKDHNGRCDFPPVAIEMNPYEADRLGWDSIMGLPIERNEKLGTGTFRVVCQKERPTEGQEVSTTQRELIHA